MMVDLERELGVPSQKKAVERRHGARCQWRNDMESTFFFFSSFRFATASSIAFASVVDVRMDRRRKHSSSDRSDGSQARQAQNAKRKKKTGSISNFNLILKD